MDSNYDKNPEGSKPSGFFASTRIKEAPDTKRVRTPFIVMVNFLRNSYFVGISLWLENLII